MRGTERQNGTKYSETAFGAFYNLYLSLNAQSSKFMLTINSKKTYLWRAFRETRRENVAHAPPPQITKYGRILLPRLCCIGGETRTSTRWWTRACRRVICETYRKTQRFYLPETARPAAAVAAAARGALYRSN